MDQKRAGDSREVELPSSYADLPFEQLRLFHVPETSKEVTPVVIVQLYRPKNYNAFTEKLMRELETAFELFDLDGRIKCIVLTGHGKMFCAGADLDIGSVLFRHALGARRCADILESPGSPKDFSMLRTTAMVVDVSHLPSTNAGSLQ
jgi:hypothetical protein